MTLTDLQVYYLVNYIQKLDKSSATKADILDDLAAILGGTFNQMAYAYNHGADLMERRSHILEF